MRKPKETVKNSEEEKSSIPSTGITITYIFVMLLFILAAILGMVRILRII